MSKIPYSKPPFSFQKQLDQLKSRGLIIGNDSKAFHLLENISYYRMSGYWYPLLLDKQNHIFKPGASLETAFKLYCFDRDLRRLVISELEKIVVAIRSQMIHTLTQRYGSFWFSEQSIFKDPVRHAITLTKIGEEYRRSDEEFINAFRLKYTDPLPPAWMTMEITSFGTLSILYKNLLPGKDKRDIAHHFGLSDKVFEGWLHSIVYLRNVCAHHARLWNRAMSIRPQFPKQPREMWLQNLNVRNNKTYFMLCMIRFLLITVNPSTSFPARIRKLLQQYQNVDIRAMDFPVNWENEPLWRAKFTDCFQ